MRMTAMERNGRCYANLREAEARYAREPLRFPMAGKPGVTAASTVAFGRLAGLNSNFATLRRQTCRLLVNLGRGKLFLEGFHDRRTPFT